MPSLDADTTTLSTSTSTTTTMTTSPTSSSSTSDFEHRPGDPFECIAVSHSVFFSSKMYYFIKSSLK